MKLIEMSVQNYRAIKGEKVKISFEGSDIIFLLGQNNAGKSSLLRSYELLVNPKHKAQKDDFYGHTDSQPIVIEGVFKKEAGDEEKFQKEGLEKWVDSDGFLKFKVEWKVIGETGEKYTFDPVQKTFVKKGFGGLDTIFMHHAPTPIRIPAMPSMDELSKWVSDVFKTVVLRQVEDEKHEAYQEVMARVQHLQDTLLTQEQVTSLVQRSNKHFQRVFPDITLQITAKDEQTLDLSKLLDKRFDLSIRDGRLPSLDQHINTQGHGVIRQAMFNVLGLLKDADGLSHEKKAFLLLFEEPEIYLHPHKLTLLRQCLYDICTNSPFQVLCASHSPALIDISRPHTSLVRLARDEQGSVCNYQVGEDVFASNEDKKQRVQMINRFNPHICEAFFADEVILVEGDTETIVFRELLAKHAGNKDIFVLNTGTKNNIPFFQEVLTHFHIKQHVVHDCDTMYLPSQEGEKPKKNSAWTMNENIWTWVVKAEEVKAGLSRRYVFNQNFESAHNYKFAPGKGKPLSAYEFATGLTTENKEQPVIKFLLQILKNEERDSEFTPEDLLKLLEQAEHSHVTTVTMVEPTESSSAGATKKESAETPT